MSVSAIIWDYDGTLVDSRHRNLSVNRRIVDDLTGRAWSEFPVLRSVDAYDAAVARCRNWRDFYHREFGLSEAHVAEAGRLWTLGQLSDPTPVRAFEGVPEAIEALRHLPQAVVSQNDREIITSALGDLGLGDRFDPVIGYREVLPDRQKPAPDGLLDCLDAMGLDEPASVLYVGDHPTDAICVAEARSALRAKGRKVTVRSVAVLYGGESTDGWPVPPDFTADSPTQVVEIARRAGPPWREPSVAAGHGPEGVQ
jgi:phosphoglycolate phosphatase-like HAD superfamily hydrolase